MVEIFMPKAGMDMKEGRLIRWLKEVGDFVELDEPIMEIETDKITMEAEAPASGILLAKLVEEDTTVPVLQTVGYIGKAGEKIPEQAAAHMQDPAAGSERAVPPAALEPSGVSESSDPRGQIAATPYARKLARDRRISLREAVPTGAAGEVRGSDILALEEKSKVAVTPLARKYAEVEGVELTDVVGTGFRGKIRKADVEAVRKPTETAEAVETADQPVRNASHSREPIHIPLTPIRKAIARNMYQSLHNMAQTSDSVELDVTELVAMRKRLVEHKDLLGTKITLNDLLSYAAVKMIRTHPLANASYTDTEIITYPYVNLSMAVATEYGLMSPVVRDADTMSLVELSKALRKMVDKARARKLSLQDQQEGTFTLTNMGIFPVDDFNPILPMPQSCILGFGRCVEKPAVYRGEICIRTMMVLSVTYDHRVFDGGEVGSIMQTMKDYLEHPELFLAQ